MNAYRILQFFDTVHDLLFIVQVLIEQDHYSAFDTHSHHPLF